MLTEIVTRALSQLTGSPLSGDGIKGQFQYAYASDDGQFVAILTHDMTTYVVDLSTQRYFAECGGSPRGFAGHVLEMEGAAARSHPWPAANDLFDLDMDADELAWRNCPACVASRPPPDLLRAAPPESGQKRQDPIEPAAPPVFLSVAAADPIAARLRGSLQFAP